MLYRCEEASSFSLQGGQLRIPTYSSENQRERGLPPESLQGGEEVRRWGSSGFPAPPAPPPTCSAVLRLLLFAWESLCDTPGWVELLCMPASTGSKSCCFLFFLQCGRWKCWVSRRMSRKLQGRIPREAWGLGPVDWSTGWGFPGGAGGKEPVCQCRRCTRRGYDPRVGKIPWRKAWQPTPVFLPGESHGQRSLVGSSPWGRRVKHACVIKHTRS